MGGSLSKSVFPVPVASYCEEDGVLCYFRKSLGEKELVFSEHRIVWLTTSSGSEISAVFIKGSSSEATCTLLLSHSNGEDLGVVVAGAKSYADFLECDIFCYEYSGYGISSGTPSEGSCYGDINAAYDYLVNDRNISPVSLVLLGRGIGSGPSIELARSRLVGGVILISAFTSVLKAAQIPKIGPHADMFVNVDKIGKLRCDVLLVHGKSDMIVPFSHSKKLYERLWKKTRPLWINGADHHEVETTYRDELLDRILTFIDRLEPPDVEFNDHHDVLRIGGKLKYMYRPKGKAGDVPSTADSQTTGERSSDSPLFDNFSGEVSLSQLDGGDDSQSIEGFDGFDLHSQVSSLGEDVLLHGETITVTDSTQRRIEIVQRIATKNLGKSWTPDGLFTLRCLRVKKFNTSEAARLIQRYLRMLVKLGVDGRLGVPFYSVETLLRQDVFIYPKCKARDGGTLFILRLNKYFTRIVKWRQALKGMLYVLETILTSDAEAQRKGITFLADMRGWTLKENYSSDFFIELFRTVQWSYPVVTRSMLFVDSPTNFNALFTTLRPILSNEFSRKIVRDVTRKNITDYVSSNSLPGFMGGSLALVPAHNEVDYGTEEPRLRINSETEVVKVSH